MFSIVSVPTIAQAFAATTGSPRSTEKNSTGAWRRLVAVVAVVALVGVLLAALAGGWFAPVAHGAGTLASATTMTPHQSLAIAPHIVCGALSLPC